jgi:uncharacterized LabA/DUF88 family protein
MTAQKQITRLENEESALRLAVLIDADNAQASVINGLLAEIARFGEATVKRIYGDFTSPTSAQWKKVLNKYAIKPVQQFAYTTGKNSTDSTLIIDAMDLLYTRRFDGFCLVSSDSDFTGLALRIREEGLVVLGFGEKKTPEAFRNACHKFVLTEVLRPTNTRNHRPVAHSNNSREASGHQTQMEPPTEHQEAFPSEFILEALELASDDSGWAHLGTFGSYLTKLQPDFDARVYGFRKLSDLVKAKPDIFVFEERKISGVRTKLMYVKAAK